MFRSSLLKITLLLLLPALGGSLALGQSVSSSVRGTLVDASGGVVLGAACTLINESTGATLHTESGEDGGFVFPNVPPARYILTAQAVGFKEAVLTDLEVSANEVRALGTIALEVGEVVDSVTVSAERSGVQLNSAERSGLVSGAQLNEIAIKGRDLVSFLSTLPGIVDENATERESIARNALNGVSIDGARPTQSIMMHDGMPAIDTGNNGTPDTPNLDSVAEVKVLKSQYTAESGRNIGGLVTVVTKSGTQDFHGSAYHYYRHESLNANNFFDNRTGTSKSPYRWNIYGWSVGGPAFIPKTFNTQKDKLFFFFSQEIIGSRISFPTRLANTPTELERRGDFSQSYDVRGRLLVIRDPKTGEPFPGNVIPQERINLIGQSILNFYPLPNFTDPDPNNLYRWNHRATFSGKRPRRQEVLRVDGNFWPSLQAYYRLSNYADTQETPYRGAGWVAGRVNYVLTPVDWERPARSHVFRATKAFSSTLVNEFTFGKAFNSVIANPQDPSKLERSLMGNPPQWYEDSDRPSNWIPEIRFGNIPANPIESSPHRNLPFENANEMYMVSNNLSKVWGSHNLKFGIYIERNGKLEPAGVHYRGQYNFARNVNNPLDTRHGFSNALLGVFRSYTEATAAPIGDIWFWNVEWYAHDNWRVNRRLTLDLGLRFYHIQPPIDLNDNFTVFDPARFDPANAPALYMPALNASGQRVAQDPLTGEFAPSALIGLFVPGSGDPANGSVMAGTEGTPEGRYSLPGVVLGPRFGFAYDLTGDGKTALRGGFGILYDRSQLQGGTSQPPTVFSPSAIYGSFDTLEQSAGLLGPSSLGPWFGEHKPPSTMKFSLGVQRQISTAVIDVSYVGGLSRHLMLRRNLNPISMFARFDPANEDPSRPGSGIPLPANFLRPYRGYGAINVTELVGTSNYNALQASVNKRFSDGLQFGMAYTWARSLGVASSDGDSVSPYFSPRSRNYGPLDLDRRHAFTLNYIYELPRLGTRMGWRPARWILDHWQISGMTTFMSGRPFTPTFGTVDGQDITGSDEGARITVVGDPRLDKSERTFDRYFRTEAFQRTPQGEFGNAGVGILTGPGVNNWDIALSKRFPLFAEDQSLRFRMEMFNAWNHPQFSGLFTSAQFDEEGNQTDPRFGSFSDARPARIIQLSLRLEF